MRQWIDLSVVVIAVVLGAGCGSTTKTIGAGAAVGGLVIAATGTVLAAGCTHTGTEPPYYQTRGACLPDDTWDKTKPYILSGIVVGAVLAGTGIAIIANDETSSSQPAVPASSGQPSRARPTTDSGCKDSTFCY
jgi:hypothetical protein